MSKRSILVLVASLAMTFGATSAFAANSLDVNTSAAIVGTYGLEVLIDGTDNGNAVFVADTTPAAETVYRFGFRIGHNSLSMDEGTGHPIFMGRQGSGGGNIIRIFMRRQGGNYKIVCRARKDAGGTGFCGQFTFAPVNTRFTLEWMAGDGSGNGLIRLYKGDNLQAERTNFDNDTFVIDTARLGAPQGIPPTAPNTDGSFYLDDFSSFRTLAP